MSNYRDKCFDDNDSNYGWYTCVRCGKKLRKGDADIDHIIPQNYHGGDNLNNLQCMCKNCNRSKQDDLDNSISDYARNTMDNTINNVKKGFNGLFKKS